MAWGDFHLTCNIKKLYNFKLKFCLKILSTCTILIRVYHYFIAQIFSFVPCVSSPSSCEYRSRLSTIDISENNKGEFA